MDLKTDGERAASSLTETGEDIKDVGSVEDEGRVKGL
jgi:hypothetical protein